MAIVDSLSHKPFFMTLQGENGKPIQLENTIYLQGEWEVALSQLYYAKNSISIYKDSYPRIVIAPSEKSNDPNVNAWNAMLSHLKTVSEFQGMRLDVTIWFPAGHYREDTLLHTLNNVIRQQEQIQGYYRESQYKLTNGESAPFCNPPEFRDYDGHTVLWCNLDDVKYIEMNRELAFMLGFAPHAKHGPGISTILEKGMTDVAPIELLSSSIRPPNGEIFYYFVYLDIIEYQTIGDITEPLIRIIPVMNQDEIVHESQFDTLYYVPIRIKAFDKLIPNIQSEFGEEILFRSFDPLYVFHFCPKSV